MSEQSVKKKNGKALRMIIVPLIAMLMIAAGAMLLHLAIRGNQAQKDREVVKSRVVLEQMKAVPVYENVIAFIGKLPEGCTVIPVPSAEGEEPPANAVTYEEAATIGAGNIQLAMNEEVTGNLFVRYEKYEGMTSGTYEVYAGSTGSLEDGNWNDARYTSTVSAVTGEMKNVMWHSLRSEIEEAKQSEKENPGSRWQETELPEDSEFEKKAIEFITEKYLGEGRKIITTFIDGVQKDFYGRFDTVLDCYVGVEPGTCYLLKMGYPGLDVYGIIAYSAEEAANEDVFDAQWVTEVKAEIAQKLEQKKKDAAFTPENLSPEEAAAFWADIREKQKTLGWEGGYPDPEDPNTYVSEDGQRIIYVDPETGMRVGSMGGYPEWPLPGWINPAEFRVYGEEQQKAHNAGWNAMIREKQKTLGWEGGYPDPRNPNTFIRENGNFVYVDLNTGEIQSETIDAPKGLNTGDFRVYEEYFK